MIHCQRPPYGVLTAFLWLRTPCAGSNFVVASNEVNEDYLTDMWEESRRNDPLFSYMDAFVGHGNAKFPFVCETRLKAACVQFEVFDKGHAFANDASSINSAR